MSCLCTLQLTRTYSRAARPPAAGAMQASRSHRPTRSPTHLRDEAGRQCRTMLHVSSWQTIEGASALPSIARKLLGRAELVLDMAGGAPFSAACASSIAPARHAVKKARPPRTRDGCGLAATCAGSDRSRRHAQRSLPRARPSAQQPQSNSFENRSEARPPLLRPRRPARATQPRRSQRRRSAENTHTVC